MASHLTQAEDTPHNIRAKELFAVFNDPAQPAAEQQRARDEFFFNFEHLAYSYARQVLPRWDDKDREDIKQTAAYALCCARDMWEPERGPFATILMFAIRNEVRNWLRQKDMIVRSHRTFHLHAQQIKEGQDASSTEPIKVASLDALIHESSEYSTSLRIAVADPDSKVPHETTDLKVSVRQVVDRLPIKERTIVINYYGLDGDDPKTLRDTATIVGRSHETVRQSLARSQRTMRNSLHGYA